MAVGIEKLAGGGGFWRGFAAIIGGDAAAFGIIGKQKGTAAKAGASTALPPWRSTARPACVASGLAATTIACGAIWPVACLVTGPVLAGAGVAARVAPRAAPRAAGRQMGRKRGFLGVREADDFAFYQFGGAVRRGGARAVT